MNGEVCSGDAVPVKCDAGDNVAGRLRAADLPVSPLGMYVPQPNAAGADPAAARSGTAGGGNKPGKLGGVDELGEPTLPGGPGGRSGVAPGSGGAGAPVIIPPGPGGPVTVAFAWAACHALILSSKS